MTQKDKNIYIYTYTLYIYIHIQESLGIIVGELSMIYMIYGDSLKAIYFFKVAFRSGWCV